MHIITIIILTNNSVGVWLYVYNEEHIEDEAYRILVNLVFCFSRSAFNAGQQSENNKLLNSKSNHVKNCSTS
ncbi:hypothetical protein BACEGG_02035 [Bacteroides eggerthii DSM 20697]|nr:hypothetical protein BACEGG_02035 [Bacteroides eggerthii DSM 20697]RHJ37889.1 hypothetical protein DW130_13365 [Bacteroides eggerthii]RHM67474.1 hypothetical protein DWZ51_10215 [Bacteroides eggerthii]